jgi:hypothetical protein
MIARFRLLKKSDPERVVGEGVRFSNGRIAFALGETRDVQSVGDTAEFRGLAARSGVEIDWTDVPEDDFAEPATMA